MYLNTYAIHRKIKTSIIKNDKDKLIGIIALLRNDFGSKLYKYNLRWLTDLLLKSLVPNYHYVPESIYNVFLKQAIYTCVNCGKNEMALAVIKSDKNIDDYIIITAMLLSAPNGNTNFAIELLSYIKDINTVLYHGFTALELAAKNGNSKLLEALLLKGAKYSSRTLFFAARAGNIDNLEFLIKYGVDINAIVQNDMTALQLINRIKNIKNKNKVIELLSR